MISKEDTWWFVFRLEFWNSIFHSGCFSSISVMPIQIWSISLDQAIKRVSREGSKLQRLLWRRNWCSKNRHMRVIMSVASPMTWLEHENRIRQKAIAMFRLHMGKWILLWSNRDLENFIVGDGDDNGFIVVTSKRWVEALLIIENFVRMRNE
jgi:hypothetical protein